MPCLHILESAVEVKLHRSIDFTHLLYLYHINYLQAYAMSEILMAISLSFDAKIALGAVGSDVMIKLVDTGYY